jgi:hypothetical protein
LTGEIEVEVTGVVGVSPALWYFRYIASIFLTTQTTVLGGCQAKSSQTDRHKVIELVDDESTKYIAQLSNTCTSYLRDYNNDDLEKVLRYFFTALKKEDGSYYTGDSNFAILCGYNATSNVMGNTYIFSRIQISEILKPL